MRRLTHEQRIQVINCLIEGCSIRATVRMTGVAKKTVMRLLVEVGTVCEPYQDRVFRNLTCHRIQLDELWGFNYCKAKTVTPEIADRVPGAGDVWLWVALDADTKLVPCWQLGDRNRQSGLLAALWLQSCLFGGKLVFALDLAVATAVPLALALVRSAPRDTGEFARSARVAPLTFDAALALLAPDADKGLVAVRKRVHHVAVAASTIAAHLNELRHRVRFGLDARDLNGFRPGARALGDHEGVIGPVTHFKRLPVTRLVAMHSTGYFVLGASPCCEQQHDQKRRNTCRLHKTSLQGISARGEKG